MARLSKQLLKTPQKYSLLHSSVTFLHARALQLQMTMLLWHLEGPSSSRNTDKKACERESMSPS